MNEDRIRQIAAEVYQQLGTQFGVPVVPTHFHTGVDTNQLPFTNLSDVPNSYTGKAGKVATVNTSETGLEFDTASGGTPGGADTDVQFNDSGAFGGNSGFTYNKTTNLITVTASGGAAEIDGGPDRFTFRAVDGASAKVQAGDAITTGSGLDVTVQGGSSGGDTGTSRGGDAYITPGDGFPGAGGGRAGNVVLMAINADDSTSRVGNFVYIPTSTGTPTGTPDALGTSAVPIVYDTTNNKLCAYNGGAWKCSAAFT